MPVAPLIELKEKCMGGSGISTPGLINLSHGKSLIALTFLFNVGYASANEGKYHLIWKNLEWSYLISQ